MTSAFHSAPLLIGTGFFFTCLPMLITALLRERNPRVLFWVFSAGSLIASVFIASVLGLQKVPLSQGWLPIAMGAGLPFYTLWQMNLGLSKPIEVDDDQVGPELQIDGPTGATIMLVYCLIWVCLLFAQLGDGAS